MKPQIRRIKKEDNKKYFFIVVDDEILRTRKFLAMVGDDGFTLLDTPIGACIGTEKDQRDLLNSLEPNGNLKLLCLADLES